MPKTCKSPNRKRFYQLEERCTEIERDNRILMEKMKKIHEKPHRQLSDYSKRKPSLNVVIRRKRLKEIKD